ncbi:MAG: redoxin domain-containing protein [candidate division Zixibacteria bacterium]|nr:redoxin domain-containing protein [candidate division Zixibacteria bacterium]
MQRRASRQSDSQSIGFKVSSKLASALLAMGILLLCGCSQSELGAGDQNASSENASGTNRSGGVEAPNFTLTSLSGESVQLSDYRGDVVVIDFWATWCGPCRRTIPDLIDLYKEHKAEGFTILGVALERHGTERLIPYVEDKGIPYPVLLGDASVVRLYGNIRSIPTAFLVDRDGTVRRKIVGAQPRKVLEDAITELLDEPRSS